MRYLIGIFLGLLIVFNWSSIKTYFDKQIDQQAGTVSPPSIGNVSEELLKSSQTEKTTSEKKDPFKEFK